MENAYQEGSKWFSLCLALLLLTTLLINLLSAYIRLDEAGVGCVPWPECYAKVGALVAPPGESPAAALTPTETAKRAHRTIATGLVVLVALVVYQARQRKLTGVVKHLPLAIVATILVLSVVGPASYLKTLPAIATVNILGGVTLLALTWWLWLGARFPISHGQTRKWGSICLGLVGLQVALGAWVSANFAAPACTALFECSGEFKAASSAAFWYFRELGLDAAGRIEINTAQVWIQTSHHLGAMLVSFATGLFALRCLTSGGRMVVWGACLLAVLLGQIGVGLGMLDQLFPLALVLSHGLLASLLILILMRILYLPATELSAADQDVQ